MTMLIKQMFSAIDHPFKKLFGCCLLIDFLIGSDWRTFTALPFK